MSLKDLTSKGLLVCLGLAFLIAGCGGSSATSPSPQPLNPAGIYKLSYTEKSGGTCGAETPGTVTITSTSNKFTWTESGISSDTGSMLCTADNCKTTVSTTLSGITEAYDVTITATGMTGTQVATITTSSSYCSSTYSVTGIKQ